MNKINDIKEKLQEKILRLKATQNINEKIYKATIDALVEKNKTEINIERQSKEMTSIIKDLKSGISVDHINKKISIKKPTWFKIEKLEENLSDIGYSIDRAEKTLINENKRQRDGIFKQTEVLVSVIGSVFTNLTNFLTKLSNKVFMVQNTPEHYKTPQTFIQLDPKTNKPVDPNKKQPISVGVSMPSAQFNSLRTSIQDSLDQYKVNDVDESADPKYYGFSDKDGKWYILENTSDSAFRYSKGDDDYSTNWTNRASLTYDLFHNIF